MKDKSAEGLEKNDKVVFKPGMLYSGEAKLIASPVYENIADGGSGFYFRVELPDGTVANNLSCSMFEEPNMEKVQT